MNKKGFEMSFAWLFAILVGVAVLFVAIYATTQTIRTERLVINTETAAGFGALLHPVETNLESGRFTTITFPDTTRVYNSCLTIGTFGQQRLRTSVRSGVGQEWAEPGEATTFYNKYIFSQQVEEGDEQYVLVKPIEMPYKVGDAIVLTSDYWCYVDPPGAIADEISDLNLPFIEVQEEVSSCEAGRTTVCFGSGTCDITVNPVLKRVQHESTVVYYEEPLLYAAIMSDPAIYNCQIARLGKRAGELAYVYAAKTDYLSGRGCSSNLGEDLRTFAEVAQIESSEELESVWTAGQELGRRNDVLACELF